MPAGREFHGSTSERGGRHAAGRARRGRTRRPLQRGVASLRRKRRTGASGRGAPMRHRDDAVASAAGENYGEWSGPSRHGLVAGDDAEHRGVGPRESVEHGRAGWASDSGPLDAEGAVAIRSGSVEKMGRRLGQADGGPTAAFCRSFAEEEAHSGDRLAGRRHGHPAPENANL